MDETEVERVAAAVEAKVQAYKAAGRKLIHCVPSACLLGAIAFGKLNEHKTVHAAAMAVLGVNEEVVLALEAGFEGWPKRLDHPAFAVGARYR
jgi:hypothetical protein